MPRRTCAVNSQPRAAGFATLSHTSRLEMSQVQLCVPSSLCVDELRLQSQALLGRLTWLSTDILHSWRIFAASFCAASRTCCGSLWP